MDLELVAVVVGRGPVFGGLGVPALLGELFDVFGDVSFCLFDGDGFEVVTEGEDELMEGDRCALGFCCF